MILKKKLLRKSRLYIILDKETSGKKSLLKIAKEAALQKDCIIQLRDKRSTPREILQDAWALSNALSGTKTLFIINDYLEIAALVNCDGVHLGQQDIPIELARRILGNKKIIGISCHNLAQAIEAQKKGADYIGIGPIFSTPTKPEYQAIGRDILKDIKKNITIPFFPIGGIDETTIQEVVSAGAKKASVCRAVCKKRSVAQAIQNLKKYLHR